jgi:hypothetical protein
MSKLSHRFFISVLSLVVILTTIYLIYLGSSYYNTILEERFYHIDHNNLKPSGPFGHGLGILGSVFMFIGVSTYMIRKRSRRLSKVGLLKHWLEFHIFLCTLGPILVLFHTSFKFGGIVSISFWSMIAVFVSGIIGRFIYIQIPRTIEGREMSLSEIKDTKTNLGTQLKEEYNLPQESYDIIIKSIGGNYNSTNVVTNIITGYFEDGKSLRKINKVLKHNNLSKEESKQIIKNAKNEISLNRRISRLTTMQNLFKYWHVAHLPFALIMLIIMIIHVIVTITFGYRWIF